jgi:hypothetical protein
VKIAVLLVTTAWLAGADQPPAGKPGAPAPGPAPAVVSHGGGACCDNACDDCGGGFLSRLRGLFHRDCGDDCCGSNDRCGWSHRTTWGHSNTCDSCGDECGLCSRLRGKLRGMFNRNDCCEPCCDGGSVPPPPGRGPEPIPAPKEAPKKMPEAKQVRIITPPPLAPATELAIER